MARCEPVPAGRPHAERAMPRHWSLAGGTARLTDDSTADAREVAVGVEVRSWGSRDGRGGRCRAGAGEYMVHEEHFHFVAGDLPVPVQVEVHLQLDPYLFP
eukprot:EG_transcript_41545